MKTAQAAERPPAIKINVGHRAQTFSTQLQFTEWVKTCFRRLQCQPVMRTTRKGHKGLQRALKQTVECSELTTSLRAIGLPVSGFCPDTPSDDAIQLAFTRLNTEAILQEKNRK